MKPEVYYFTGTGNSLIVAKDIAKELDAEIFSISSALKKGTVKTEADTLVIVFPVYIWGFPLIIERFVRSIEKLNEKDIYAIATYGGMPGATINLLDKLIESCSGKLASGFSVAMPGNYTPMYGAIKKKRQLKMFDKWQKRRCAIAEHIKTKGHGIKENSNFFLNFIFSEIINKNSTRYMPQMDKQFWVDEKCNKCGICEKICPVSNIEMMDGKPNWKHNCEQCFACLQWCPKESIQYGKATSKRKRYHHPDVGISDMVSTVKE